MQCDKNARSTDGNEAVLVCEMLPRDLGMHVLRWREARRANEYPYENTYLAQRIAQ